MNMMDPVFSCFTLCVFFSMIFFSSGAGAVTFLDGSSSDSGSEQNVTTAPAPAPAKM